MNNVHLICWVQDCHDVCLKLYKATSNKCKLNTQRPVTFRPTTHLLLRTRRRNSDDSVGLNRTQTAPNKGQGITPRSWSFWATITFGKRKQRSDRCQTSTIKMPPSVRTGRPASLKWNGRAAVRKALHVLASQTWGGVFRGYQGPEANHGKARVFIHKNMFFAVGKTWFLMVCGAPGRSYY